MSSTDSALRDSRAWVERQRSLYDRLGVDAFTRGIVPWRLSTSQAMARLVVQVAGAFARDVGRARVCIVELGGGSGRLAFHVAHEAQHRGLALRYVLTDGASSMVENWKQHAQLASAVEARRVDVADVESLRDVLHIENDEALVVVGTYLLDTLVNRLVTVPADDRETPFTRAWTRRFSRGQVLMPTGAFGLVESLEAATATPTLVVFADKGALEETEALERGDAVRLAAHEEGVSAWVNFPALAAWLGWRGMMTHPVNDPAFAVMATALHRGALRFSGTREALRQAAHPLVVQRARTALRTLEGERLCEAVVALEPDADAVLELADQLRVAVKACSVLRREQLVRWLVASAQRAFFMQSDDVIFHVGTIVQAAGFLELAIACYDDSIARFGSSIAAHFNRAMCLLDAGQLERGVESLRAVLAIDQHHVRAAEILASLNRQ